MIKLENLTKHFSRIRAVDGLDLHVKEGEICGFLGPNGAGKTTTIRLLTGILQPTSGRVLIGGVDVAERPRYAKQQIGFYYTTALYHSILRHHDLESVGAACRAALARFDVGAMADAIPDSLVDEIAIAGTPDEARDRLAQWKDLTDEPLLYAPTVGVPPERIASNVDAMLDVFGTR